MKKKKKSLSAGGSVKQFIITKYASVLFRNGFGTPFETKEIVYTTEQDLENKILPRGSVTKRYTRTKIIKHLP